MTAPGYRLVPEAVLLWLNGEGPDHEGYEFGEAPNRGPGAFWWRARLREMLAAAPHPEPPANGAFWGWLCNGEGDGQPKTETRS